ncbi:MAG: ABC transporter permease [Vulcanimicrobiaceae bacterium]
MNEFITVLSAEIMRRLNSRAFKIGLLVGMAAIALFIKAPALLGSALSAGDTIVLAGAPDLTSRAAQLLSKDFEIAGTITSTSVPTIHDLDSHKKAGAIVIITHAKNGIAVNVYARNLSSISRKSLNNDLLPLNLALGTAAAQSSIDRFMNVPIEVHGLDTKFQSVQASDAAQGIASMLLVFLYISILLNSQLLMTSVAEEKTSRIAELLIASVNPSALLAGKIGAAAILGIIQMASWFLVAFVLGANGSHAAHVHGSTSGLSADFAAGVTQADILAFGAFFLIGYLQLSTLFAAFASMINRVEDLGSVSYPLVMPVVGALFLAMYALGVPNAPIVLVTSFVPILAPFTMFARIAVSVVPTWQIVLSFAINIAAIWLIAIGAGKIYRVGMMTYGRPPKLQQIWATLRG